MDVPRSLVHDRWKKKGRGVGRPAGPGDSNKMFCHLYFASASIVEKKIAIRSSWSPRIVCVTSGYGASERALAKNSAY